MELLTEELREQLPPLYRQTGNKNPYVYIKYFLPDSYWTWFVTEGSPEGNDYLFYGYVIGFEREWKSFYLSELEIEEGPTGLPLERDLQFKQDSFSTVIQKYKEEHDGTSRLQ